MTHLDHCISHKLIPTAISCVEIHTASKAQEQTVAAVGICDVEGWVLHQGLYPGHIARHAAASLGSQPLQQHQRLVLVCLAKLLQCKIMTATPLVGCVRATATAPINKWRCAPDARQTSQKRKSSCPISFHPTHHTFRAMLQTSDQVSQHRRDTQPEQPSPPRRRFAEGSRGRTAL
jgi:hypothetical protein